MDLMGWEVGPGLDGLSLIPLIRGRKGPRPASAFSEALAPHAEFGWPPLYALTDDRFSYIHHKRPELYRMDIDPRQNHEISAENAEEAARRRSRLLDFAKKAVPLCDPHAAGLDEGQKELLVGLGYIGGGSGPGRPSESLEEVDYREKVPFVDEAIKLRSIVTFDGSPERLREAVAGFLAMEKKYPDMPFLIRGKGDAYAALGQNAQAEAAYLRLVALEPQAWEPRRSLARFYETRGQPAKAAAQLREVLRLSPDDGEAWKSLALNLRDMGDLEGAQKAMNKARALGSVPRGRP
jgi:tetratricopeptide (TPR) repeat protein